MAKTFTSNGRLKGFDSDKGSCLEGNPEKHKSSLLQFYDNDTLKYCQGNRFKIWPLCNSTCNGIKYRQASSSHNQSSLVLVSDLSNQKLESK